MLTFSALSESSLKIVGADAPVVVFPESAPKGDGITILSVPLPAEEYNERVISWPGEYNLSGISFRGIGHNDGKQVSYVMTADGIRIGVLSAPLQDWTDTQIESVGDIDVLVLPAGETKLCQKLIDEFDPRILIVLPGKEKGALGAIEKILGSKKTESDYKVKSLPAEGREVVVLA